MSAKAKDVSKINKSYQNGISSKRLEVVRSSGKDEDFVKVFFYFAIVLQIISFVILKTKLGSGLTSTSLFLNMAIPGIIIYKASSWKRGFEWAFYSSLILPLATSLVMVVVAIVGLLVMIKSGNVKFGVFFKNIFTAIKIFFLTYFTVFMAAGIHVIVLSSAARAIKIYFSKKKE